MAFTLTICYKEVLLANLVNVGYEDSNDNFDDLLRSGKPICMAENTNIPLLFFNDPRDNVKQLLNNIVYFNYTGVIPKRIRNG